MPGLELRSGTSVLAQERRQRAQQPTEIGAAHLTGDAKGLHDAISDRIGKPRLEPVQTCLEASGGPVVLTKTSEGGLQRLWPPVRELGQRLGQRHACSDCRCQVVDNVGPEIAQLLPTLSLPTADECRRRASGEQAECNRYNGGERDDVDDDHDDKCETNG